jgi:hypothetical protein
VLTVAPPLSLLCTPYGPHAIAYYASTLGNSALRRTVSEWRPVTTSVLVAVPFLLLVGVMAWSFVRCPRRTTLWERLALLMVAAAAADAIRNVTFFAVLALAILPTWLSRPGEVSAHQAVAVRRRLNTALLGLAVVLVTASVLTTLSRPAAQLEGSYYKPTMLAAIQTAARTQAGLRIVADARYGDWILWQMPRLAGRVAADARYELYTPVEIGRLAVLPSSSATEWERATYGYRLFVLDRSADGGAVRRLLREAGARVLYADQRAIVVLRSRPAPEE